MGSSINDVTALEGRGYKRLGDGSSKSSVLNDGVGGVQNYTKLREVICG